VQVVEILTVLQEALVAEVAQQAALELLIKDMLEVAAEAHIKVSVEEEQGLML